MLVDSHCHLSGLSLEGKGPKSMDEVIARAMACGVTHFLSIACTMKEFAGMAKLLAPYENVYLAGGIHPLNLEEEPDWSEDTLAKIFDNPKVLALGETGLDFHYMPETREAQLKSFARQIELAVALKKPLIVHAREAHSDTIKLMRSLNARDCGGVIHCFTDTVEMARECLDLGYYISFTGISTFRASDNVREVVKYVPLDRMMVETDCPYLAPVPVRGVENEPAFVRHTLNFIAAFKNVSQRELAAITSRNFEDLYGVKLKTCGPPQCEFNEWKLEKICRVPFSDTI